MKLFTAYAHPIGEDADVFWVKTGRTEEEAIRRLKVEVQANWSDEADVFEINPETGVPEKVFEDDGDEIDFEDGTWVLVVDEDELED